MRRFRCVAGIISRVGVNINEELLKYDSLPVVYSPSKSFHLMFYWSDTESIK